MRVFLYIILQPLLYCQNNQEGIKPSLSGDESRNITI